MLGSWVGVRWVHRPATPKVSRLLDASVRLSFARNQFKRTGLGNGQQRLIAVKNEELNQAVQATRSSFRLARLEGTGTRMQMGGSEWSSYGLDDSWIAGLNALGAPRPNNLQRRVLGTLLKGPCRALMGGETGSGKTIAYLLPAMMALKREESFHALDPRHNAALRVVASPRAIVLVPSYELALQVHAVAKKLSHHVKMRVKVLHRVMSADALKRLHQEPMDLLVTTPHQLLKMPLKLDRVSHLIVDEADTLLTGEFGEQVKRIITFAKQPPSILLAAATVSQSMEAQLKQLNITERLFTRSLHQPLETNHYNFLSITGEFVDKRAKCLEVLRENPHFRTLIFCNRAVTANRLQEFLIQHGQNPSLVHSWIPEKQREVLLSQFTAGTINHLITTDLVSRGLDTRQVEHVIMFDFPTNLMDFIHRAGRAGRAKQKGLVTALINQKDRRLAEYIRLMIKQGKALSEPLEVNKKY